jgi:HPt (histidine-containing phosphotransfer) domain-containing protein
VIDWARVAELRTDMGDEGFEVVVELFMSEIEAALVEMARNFPETISDDLHFLKGSSANIGFKNLRDICINGENNRDKVDPVAIASCYFESKSAFLAGL